LVVESKPFSRYNWRKSPTLEDMHVVSNKALRELESWLTPSEAGRTIGITKQGAIKRLEAGKLRGVKTHQGWLVDPEDVSENGG
jgi:hypothetical protein